MMDLVVLCFRYQELATTESLTALHYLQTSLSEIIDHEDQDQTKEVRYELNYYSAVRFFTLNGFFN